PFALTALMSIVATLAACGGGSGSDGADQSAAPLPVPAASAPAVALATISGRVADGPLAGVQVCYDLNDNAACDAGEPATASTDSDGRYSFGVDMAAAGKHRVIAVVPASAIDKDTGAAIGTALQLVAPASGVDGTQQVFVSVLTTLVQSAMDTNGQSLADASAFVATQAGLTVSPLADFTADLSAGSIQAATLARLSTKTLMGQVTALESVVLKPDAFGSPITAADVQRAALGAVLGILPTVAAAAGEPAIADAVSGTAREAALVAAGQRLAASSTGLSADSAALLIGVAKLPADATPDTPEPGASLLALRFTDANNWNFRAYLLTASDATIDAAGLRHYYELRTQNVAGQVTAWGAGSSPDRQGDVHWSGAAWITCPLGTRNSTTPDDSAGRADYVYCGYEAGTRTRSRVDVSGRTMRSVVESIRQVPGSSGGVSYSEFGPADLGLLGTATLPAGSTLAYQTSTPLSSGVSYDVRASGIVSVYPPEVAAGGDARSGGTPACNLPAVYAPVANLEELVARSPGTPCKVKPNSNATGTSGERNDWWSNSTVSLGTVANAQTPPAGTGGYFSSNAVVKVAFVAGSNAVNYYSCLQRAVDGSNRNCDRIGGGTYRIETLGDARTMSFTGLPTLALQTGSTRVFVERGGKVYYGYKNPTGTAAPAARLNLVATNALFAQLGLPALTPVP
ncbi:MAG: hypothetical protein ABI564_13060, partial [Ideonella sp.]